MLCSSPVNTEFFSSSSSIFLLLLFGFGFKDFSIITANTCFWWKTDLYGSKRKNISNAQKIGCLISIPGHVIFNFYLVISIIWINPRDFILSAFLFYLHLFHKIILCILYTLNNCRCNTFWLFILNYYYSFYYSFCVVTNEHRNLKIKLKKKKYCQFAIIPLCPWLVCTGSEFLKEG